MTTVTIRSGDSAALANPALTPMVLGCSRGGTVGKVYTFNPGDDVVSTLRGGTGCDYVLALLRESQGRVLYTPCTPTWTAAPSITHVGTGPAVTCALTAGEPGCFDDYTIKMTVKQGGNGGAGASLDVAYDGSTNVEVLQVPAENPAALVGKIDITNGAVLVQYAATVLTHETLDFTAPAAASLDPGIGSLAAATAGLRAAFATSIAVQTWTASDLLAPGKAAILANARKITFLTGGVTPANAPATVTITGFRYGVAKSEVLSLSQVAGNVSSVETYTEITSFVFAAGDGAAATIAAGYSSAFATAAEIVTALNEEALTAPLDVVFSVVSTASGQYLGVTSTGVGSGVTMTIDDAASTADTPLGFSSGAGNLTTTGYAATWSPAWTGKTFTFPATSDYVAGDTYTLTTVGPRAALAAIADAAIAARDNYINAPFGYLVVLQPAPDARTCKATNDALAALTNGTWLPDPYAPIFVTSVVGGPFHTASATLATNNANITITDAAMLAAFGSASANLDSVAVDDVYVTGAPQLISGSFRRSAALAWAVKAGAKVKLAADVADGLLPNALGASLVGPDGVTRARDFTSQTTHLESNLGFSCLGRTSQGLGFPKFAPGYTRAGATSRLRFMGVVVTCLETATIAFPVAERWVGQTDVVNTFTGQLSDQAKKERGNAIYSALKPTLQPENGPPNVSDFTVEILDPTTGRFVDNNEIRVKIVLYVLGEIITVYVGISASGVNTTTIAA